jgi:hypothetical protein
VTGAVRNWTYVVEPPDDGWIWLPEPDEDLAGWAQAVCADLYTEGSVEVALGEDLRTFARTFRDGDHDLGAVWVPDPTRGVLASLVAGRVVVDRPLEQVAADFGADAEPGLAPPHVDLVVLPAGPAVRVRRVQRNGRGPAGDALVESVAHLVAPPGLVDAEDRPTAVQLVTTWALLAEGDEFAQLADETAARLRIDLG